MSPAQYRTKLRLQRAEWLLKNTGMSVTNVAMECGFKDSTSLSRSLKQAKGVNPSDLKTGRLASRPVSQPQ